MGGGSPYLPDHPSASCHYRDVPSLITSSPAREASSLPCGLEAEMQHGLNDLPKVTEEIGA